MKNVTNLLIYASLFFILTACGSNTYTASDTGSISFSLKLERPTSAERIAMASGSDICIDYGVATITITVLNSAGVSVATGNWECSEHTGTVTDIPAGTNYSVRIDGKDSAGTITWNGTKTGISVTGGTATPAGTITMTYTGSDTTPPLINSTIPSENAANVPVTTLLTASFSETMAVSTINTTTFTLKNGTTPVSGSVTYDSHTKKAIFIPANYLSYSTTYTVVITTGVEDMAGNNMQTTYIRNFNTESSPTTAPSEPTGLTAIAGDSQITINWTVVPNATAYNLYWSTTSGVSKTTGTKIANITTPYTHTGLTNDTTYYYVVTAVNNYGESSESNQISAIPTNNLVSQPELLLSETTTITTTGLVQYYKVSVSSGQILSVTLDVPSTANLNLYIKYGVYPNPDSYSYDAYSGSYTSGQDEAITIAPTQAGDYYIAVTDESGSGTYTITFIN